MPKGRYSGDERSVNQIISDEKQGSIRREFPSEYMNKRPDEIYSDAESKVISADLSRKAKKAKKLLDSLEYDKDQ